MAPDQVADLELVALAPKPSHADFHAWPVPDKSTRRRILAAHADLLGLPSTGATDDPRPVLDPDLLERAFAGLTMESSTP